MTTTTVDIPEGYVPVDYAMRPDEDDIIRGFQLEPGMVVLVEEVVFRENPERLDEKVDSYTKNRLDITSQWCQVTALDTGRGMGPGNIISFIGIYSDGAKHSRTYSESIFWIVKKESM